MAKGISSQTAQQNLQKYGKNTIKSKNHNPWWKMLLSQFKDIMVLILIGAGLVAYFSGEEVDAIVILTIVALNAFIGFFQEFRTESTLKALQNYLTQTAKVWRDGHLVEINVEEIVPEDVIELAEGDKVPADGILTESFSAQAEEAALTGESTLVLKAKDDHVFLGTSIGAGSGTLLVQKTGMDTEFGRIAHLTAEAKPTLSPLQKELGHMGRYILYITLALSVLLVFMGIFRGNSALESLLFAVSVAIAAVPEGLPTTLTVALALGAQALMRKKALMKKLSSVETLGAVTTVCTDKTGTLTRNEMTVREVYLADRTGFTVSGTGYNPKKGKVKYIGGGTGENTFLLEKLMRVCGICNDATLDSNLDSQKEVHMIGDPTEGALLTLFHKYFGENAETLKQNTSILEKIPFSSERKRMTVQDEQNVYTKGAPEVILGLCTHYFEGEEKKELTEKKRQHILAHAGRMSERALRVLGMAGKKHQNKEDLEEGLTFYGLCGMIDPPRVEVRDAVKACGRAGVRICVITGDNGKTAAAVAEEIGLLGQSDEQNVYTGKDLDEMSEEVLKNILKNRKKNYIFARTSPEHKMRLVSALQDLNEVVSMTGDGVNDAPALKKAHIGVAMGITGTEVSKEAASMVLLNDSFASIVQAIGEGRRIYANMKKFIWFIFACNTGELLTVLASLIFGFPAPLTAVLILAIDLGTDLLPAIALGTDPATPDLMQKQPRDPQKRLLQGDFLKDFLFWGGLIGLCVVAVFLFGLKIMHYDLKTAQTMAFTTLVLVQLLNAYSARSFGVPMWHKSLQKNLFLDLSVLSSVFLVAIMLYVPFMNNVLGTSPLNVQQLGFVLVGAVIPVALREMKKVYFINNIRL